MALRTGRGWGRAALAMVAVSALACLVAAPAVSAAGGPVMPANARPHGTTLTDMTKALAVFTASGNSAPLPVTPFQVLYVRPGDGQFAFVCGPPRRLRIVRYRFLRDVTAPGRIAR